MLIFFIEGHRIFIPSAIKNVITFSSTMPAHFAFVNSSGKSTCLFLSLQKVYIHTIPSNLFECVCPSSGHSLYFYFSIGPELISSLTQINSIRNSNLLPAHSVAQGFNRRIWWRLRSDSRIIKTICRSYIGQYCINSLVRVAIDSAISGQGSYCTKFTKWTNWQILRCVTDISRITVLHPCLSRFDALMSNPLLIDFHGVAHSNCSPDGAQNTLQQKWRFQ